MCKSISEGGQRCAAHTRPKYEAAAFGTVAWDEAAAAYGSTPSGRKMLEAERQRASADGDADRAIAFERAIRFGNQQREVAKATRAAIEEARRADQDRSTTPSAAHSRYNDNAALGRYRYEYDDNHNLVFDPYDDDGTNAPRGNPSHKDPQTMSAWLAQADERERIDREYWKAVAPRDLDSARRTLETVNPELAVKFDWATGTYLDGN